MRAKKVPFTKQDDDFIRDNYMTMNISEIGRQLKRVHIETVSHRMKVLGLSLPIEIIKARQRPNGFKKGNIPINKGLMMGRRKERHAYAAMKQRCNNVKSKQYVNYGGRGIAVCDRWNAKNGFRNFLSDMGLAPLKTHSIERADNNGNYEPANCRWATKKEQASNRRDTIKITIGDQVKSLKDWAKHFNVPYACVQNRFRRSYPIDTLFNQPKKYNRIPAPKHLL